MQKHSSFLSIFQKLTLSNLSSAHRVWFMFIVIVCLLLTFMIPPMQKPDENIHFQRAISVSNGLILCKSQTDEWKIQQKYQNVFRMMDGYGVTQNYLGKFNYKEYFQPIFSTDNDEQAMSSEAKVLCSLPAISYVPQATGLVLANLLHLNGIIGFYLGRFFALLVFLLSLIFILQKTHPNSRVVFLFTASIPMFLHQVGSYSYDSLLITVGLLLFYKLFEVIQKNKISAQDLIVYFSLLFFFYFIKPNSYILFFFTPILFVDKLVNTFKKGRFLLVISVFLASVMLLFATILSSMMFSTENNTSSREITPPQLQLQILENDPFKSIDVLYSTTKYESLFYLKSLVGVFGWLDYDLPLSVYLSVGGLLIYSLANFSLVSPIKVIPLKIVVSLGIIIGTYILYIGTMYLFHTSIYRSVGESLSFGSQGRYFILLIPLVFLFVGYVKQLGKIMVFIPLLLFSFMTFKICESMYLRYYDYGSVYDITSIPSHATKSLNDTSRIIDAEAVIDLPIAGSNKIKGFSFGPVYQPRNIFMPYRYSILSAACNTPSGEVIRSGIITQELFESGQFNVFFERRLELVDAEPTVFCIKLSPYVGTQAMSNNFSLIHYQADLIALPIYLR